jgi:hypothetical protein
MGYSNARDNGGDGLHLKDCSPSIYDSKFESNDCGIYAKYDELDMGSDCTRRQWCREGAV